MKGSLDKLDVVSLNSVTLKEVSFRYPGAGQAALCEVNLTIPSGQLVMIIGASGAGKSTLAHTLNGLIPQFFPGDFSGLVQIEGETPQVRGVSVMAGIIGLVFQDFETQLFSTRVELEIAVGMENRGVEYSLMHQQVKKIIAAIGLNGLEQAAPAELSGGQKQRLAIGAVLAASPKVLCLDEPTTDLDPVGKQAVFELLRDIRNPVQGTDEMGPQTILLVEHETEGAIQADRIIMMEQGRITADGPPREILPNVDLFQRNGLMPLPFCEYFQRLGLRNGAMPLTLTEAEECFRSQGWKVEAEQVRRVRAGDAARKLKYGSEIVRIEGLAQAYDGREILKDLNWCVREREFVAVLGANGSGKTTLVKHLNGLLRPKQGKVYLDGRDAATLSVFELGQVVGYVFQNPDQQIFCDTVYDEIAFALKLRGFSGNEMEDRIREALAAVGLSGSEAEDPFSLSKGQRQRVAVASILALKPKVIVLDEPTTGLDYKDQRRMMELVRSLNEAGHTIIMITHTMWVVAEYAHRIVLMNNGKIVADGDTRELFADEAMLARAGVQPPQITQLGNRVGFTALSVDELLNCTSGNEVQS